MAEEDKIKFEGCIAVKDSRSSILVRLENGDECWINKAYISDESEIYEVCDYGTLIIPEWLALERGLI